MWIARDKNGALYLYTIKPYKIKNSVWGCNDYNPIIRFLDSGCGPTITELNRDAFPEVTFENSPKELIIKDEY